MSSEIQTLRFEQVVEAPVQEVYHAFTNATALREWLCDVATVVPKPGGRFYVAWNDGGYASGEYTFLEKDREIGLNWIGRRYPGPTQVKVTWTPIQRGVQVNVEHSGMGAGDDWATARAAIDRGWKDSLENLASVVGGTGEDLRLTRRPLLGVNVGVFNPDEAQKLGVPVTEGVRLDGVDERMGAYAAGLRSGDVITQVAGKPATTMATLAGVLQQYRAGDRVDVVFYRGPAKKTVSMELSRRPLPEIPSTTKELAGRLRQRYSKQDEELRSFLANVSEEQASFRPGPDEWSVKEILAHLILGERFNGYWIGGLEVGYEPWTDDWESNSHAHTHGVVSASPNLSDLVEEMQRSEAEVVGALESLPESFSVRKGSLWRLAYALLQPDTHLQQHIEHMRSLVEAAGAKEAGKG